MTSAILGARRLEQLDENLKAADVELTGDAVARLEEIYPDPGHPAPRTPTGQEPTLVP